MPARRLEARLHCPLAPAAVRKALEQAVQGAGTVIEPAREAGYFEAALGDGGPREEDAARLPRIVWAAWWQEEEGTRVELLVEDRVTGGPTPGLAKAVHEALRETHARCRKALRGEGEVRIVPASDAPLRPRMHKATPQAQPAGPIRFERTNRFEGTDVGYEAPCPHCGGFARYKEPGRVVCHFCQHWFTLQA